MEHSIKGVKGGNCNRTACQKPGAIYYNKSTEKYYCKCCADEINWPGGRSDTMRLYGTELLCELDDPDDTENKSVDRYEMAPEVYRPVSQPNHSWQRRKKGRC